MWKWLHKSVGSSTSTTNVSAWLRPSRLAQANKPGYSGETPAQFGGAVALLMLVGVHGCAG
jgi:hypothetical protein